MRDHQNVTGFHRDATRRNRVGEDRFEVVARRDERYLGERDEAEFPTRAGIAR